MNPHDSALHLPRRTLGTTGASIPVLGFGAGPVSALMTDAAARTRQHTTIERALVAEHLGDIPGAVKTSVASSLCRLGLPRGEMVQLHGVAPLANGVFAGGALSGQLPNPHVIPHHFIRRHFPGRTDSGIFAAGAASSLVLRWTLAASVLALAAAHLSAADVPLDIGSRRELFLDDALVEHLTGKVELRLHHPVPQEIALVHDAPWEGNGSGFHSVFQDGDRYRLFYKAWNMKLNAETHRLETSKPFCCYAESADGIRWRKPELGLHEFLGAKANNIVMPDHKTKALHVNSGAPAVFRDENPAAAPDARYKAMFQCLRPKGMIPFQSADGLHWTPMSDQPVITDGAFDSQNTAFWDGARGEYRAYWRHYSQGDNDITTSNPHGDRAIRTATSKDFLDWKMQEDLRYVDSPSEALYTNAIKPYHRAPHLLIGFPTRYVDRGWSESNAALPELEHREQRRAINPRYGNAMTEGLLMASRDGVTFKRWNEAFLRPGIEREGTWNYGQQFTAWHLVETKSALEGAPNELSIYASESYWTGTSSVLRRYTLRLDGFVSARAPMSGGELVTKALTFAGSKLVVNFASSAAGGLQVELQDEKGVPLSGFALDDCAPIFGDALERVVTWKHGSDVSDLAGRPLRLRFSLKDADLFSFQFIGSAN